MFDLDPMQGLAGIERGRARGVERAAQPVALLDELRAPLVQRAHLPFRGTQQGGGARNLVQGARQARLNVAELLFDLGAPCLGLTQTLLLMPEARMKRGALAIEFVH